MNRETIARHEAGHAAMCMILGVSVKVIDTIGDGGTTVGYTVHNLDVTDRTTALHRMMVLLAGLIESADDWEQIPKWPLRHGMPGSDETGLAILADALALTAKGYDDLLHQTINIMLTREYLMLHSTITGVLDYHPRVGPELIARIQHAIDMER